VEQADCVSDSPKISYNNEEQLAPAHGKEKVEKKMCEHNLSALISLRGL